MSIIDRALAAVTPQPSDERRAEATEKARAAAEANDWLTLALDQHDQIRRCFREGREATAPEARLAAMKALADVLNPHSAAEEVVLYPAMAQHGHKMQAGAAYGEQTTTKMQMSELENIDPAAKAWTDKWEHIEGAVLTHMFEEENGWFIHLKEHAPDQARLTVRFAEEVSRCSGRSG
ncbi:hemerythrin domain-containing protein [Brevundimonas sp. 2R-24]|uniref:Hemerythrin domain-containing protein n=1 Tax=Peiella sedimenti TaxID=3061083 RepID=A0ABT8SQ66_9CAUL|nr:hemerythrin domain-containing protein [Caulobacteraceae bacterium XZ-24]